MQNNLFLENYFRETKNPLSAIQTGDFVSNYWEIMYGFKASRISFRLSSVWMARSIGLERSRLKIPMMDFASMTYLPEIKIVFKLRDGINK